MYLAPLNYDRYFKKVFSDLKIAKRFLEDFFDITIETIELLTIQHKITDDAVAVEFDFRCQIDGQLVIIDMQQWYKSDIVHRFYIYHCVNTALQLETLPLKSIALGKDKEKRVKDYSQLLPVITLVWMVDDTFGCKDDYVSYTMTPEIVLDFLNNHQLWHNEDITELLKERELALQQVGNKKRNLDFLQKNRLIYAFQKNIVRNGQKEGSKYHKYLAWFELAEKTKDKLNQKADFLKYAEDEIFAELIRRISKETLTQEDFTYIQDYEEHTEEVKRWEKPIYQDGMRNGLEKGEQIGLEKGRTEEKYKIALKGFRKGMSLEDIIELTELDKRIIVKLQSLVAKYEEETENHLNEI